ncbi:MAG TPA: ABC transporter substrate-binding protein [Microthrixaceae bacterium]|nr:ABC transporter substrate-binding protein [Microthrixaceae bacterium]
MASLETHQITSRRGAPSRRVLTAVAIMTSIATVVVGCGHSEGAATSASTPKDGAETTGPKGGDEPGVFGELGQVCGPAEGKVKASDVRGVTDDEIQIGVLNDAGNELSPGLGAAYPRVAKAFADWCNEAGGINGRKIVINDRDAKLFDSAAAVIDACQSDFMLVGGGAALDAPTIEPRLECGLGSIPAFNPSYEGQIADLQAVVGRTSQKESNWGLFRLLEPEYSESFKKIGILTVDTPDVRVAYERFQKVLEAQGLDVTSFQAVAVSLDNVRTYVQPLVGKTEALVLALPAVEIFRAMNDVGYEPKVIADAGSVFNNLDTVENLKKVPLKAPIYSASTTFPLDQSKDNSTAAKLVELETAAFGKADPADVTPWITWLLFAKSASACEVLTVDCVIENATKDKAYTAGGLMAPIDLSDPTLTNHCLAINRVSADGIVYDKKSTDPTDGLFNCDPANVVPVP